MRNSLVLATAAATVLTSGCEVTIGDDADLGVGADLGAGAELGAGGCLADAGNGSGIDSGAAPFGSWQDFAVAVREARCQYLVRVGYLAPGDLAVCRSLSAPADAKGLAWYSIPDAITAGRLAFDGGAARRCVDVFSVALSFFLYGEPPSCHHVLVPRVSDGGTCRDARECISGICQRSQRATSTHCEGTCVPRSTPHICVVDLGPGNCGFGDYCDTTDGTCKPDPGACDPCSADPRNAPPTCTYGYYCLNGQCAPSYQGTPGAACSHYDACRVDLMCRAGVCVPPGGAGDLCTGGVGECKEGLHCVNHRCTPLADNGEACDNDALKVICAEASRCVAGKCQSTLVPLGGACSSDPDCREWFGRLDLYCDKSTCREMPYPKEPCVAGERCFESTCDPMTGKCEPTCN